MNEHPIKQTPGDWETFDIHTDMAGLPYLKFVFARGFSQYQQLSTTADEELARISAWLFSRGDPPVSQLIPWEVMSWGMLSFAERLSPGLLLRPSHQRADSKGQFPGEASASTTAPNSPADGAIDGDRFAIKPGTFWKGSGGAKTWWWQLRFPEPRPVGAILQVHGDQPSILSGAPSRYRWQSSLDGRNWQDLHQTEVRNERRLFRVHRLVNAYRATYLRLMIDECVGEAPSLREVEIYADPSAKIEFGDWIIAVSTATQDRRLPGFAAGFERLVRECPGWENVLLQNVWLGDVDESFVAAEPYPLCALLSGNTLEWCQQPREPWRGIQEVLQRRNLPIWAACGGAQALAILQETGVDKPWDCPRCRDPKAPKSPVYSHLGHTGPAKCGDYTKNVWERGNSRSGSSLEIPCSRGSPTSSRSWRATWARWPTCRRAGSGWQPRAPAP